MVAQKTRPYRGPNRVDHVRIVHLSDTHLMDQGAAPFSGSIRLCLWLQCVDWWSFSHQSQLCCSVETAVLTRRNQPTNDLTRLFQRLALLVSGFPEFMMLCGPRSIRCLTTSSAALICRTGMF